MRGKSNVTYGVFFSLHFQANEMRGLLNYRADPHFHEKLMPSTNQDSKNLTHNSKNHEKIKTLSKSNNRCNFKYMK